MVITPETRRTISSFRHIATSHPRRALSRALGWDCRMVGLAGKARDRANVGLTWAGRRDTLSKLRTVRNDEGGSHYQSAMDESVFPLPYGLIVEC